ncbi:ankyrin repeat domain-containing protein [Paenibacillus sp. IB182496]|uniref:Ankyrin repeat domain-containing protein n=1 Tax=Paenibacillus sabuli TaxID=2772509 RepID=A0A927BZ13_9BACL|nr:ankyrin repeat domain-containing protein [Paenibacillus sabuli]MBD2848496.1 ankyrin repeat domain-containing protein [Paenibacillus sabuli]
MRINETDPLAVALLEAIRTGDTSALQHLLTAHPGLATARIVAIDGRQREMSRTPLHVAADWPGHFPGGAATVAILVRAGADVNARFVGAHMETPLHWAASSNDIDVLDALLDTGADIEAPGAVIAGGTPLDDAVAFGQWEAARRLVERGADFSLWHAAALGRLEAIEAHFAGDVLNRRYPWGMGGNGSGPRPSSSTHEVTVAFWCACYGGQLRAAESLLERGAELNWAAVWDGRTPLDAAMRSASDTLVKWLRDRGARSSS